MNKESKVAGLVLVSPWFLAVFFVVPIAVILSLTTGFKIPFAGPQLLLVNNICFTLLVGCRLVRYLSRLGKELRYGPHLFRPRKSAAADVSAEQARKELGRAGYAFSKDGSYGERRDVGFLGTTLLYAGLFLLLAVGILDNMQQFAGVLLDGPGPSTELSRPETYRRLTMGPLSARPDSLPKMSITRQVLPGPGAPKGATEIVLMPEGGIPIRTVLTPPEPYRYGAYDIYMAKLVFEPQIVIKTKDGQVLYDSIVRLDPLVQKRGDFSFYGLFVGSQVVGGVYYQPEKSLMKLVVTRNGQRVVGDMTFQVDQELKMGEYVVSCAKLGQWSEIHVVHRRHKGLLILGGAIALLGLALRIAVRPHRVWLEERGETTQVTAVGAETRRLLNLA